MYRLARNTYHEKFKAREYRDEIDTGLFSTRQRPSTPAIQSCMKKFSTIFISIGGHYARNASVVARREGLDPLLNTHFQSHTYIIASHSFLTSQIIFTNIIAQRAHARVLKQPQHQILAHRHGPSRRVICASQSNVCTTHFVRLIGCANFQDCARVTGLDLHLRLDVDRGLLKMRRRGCWLSIS